MSKKRKNNKPKSGLNILVIPDSHAKPGVPNDRYDWLAKFILDRKPDVIVELGDFADMASLSSYDTGTVLAENKRLFEDIAWAIDARIRLTMPILREAERRKLQKHKPYTPRLIALGGNHEHRINRVMNSSPNLQGMWTQDVSGAAELGWEFYPFGEIVKLHEINFCHYFKKQGQNKGYSGKYITHHINSVMMESCIQGHTHQFSYASQTSPLGRRIISVVAGCYFEHQEHYAGNDNNTWFRGVLMLNNVVDGSFEIEQVSMETIKRRYA